MIRDEESAHHAEEIRRNASLDDHHNNASINNNSGNSGGNVTRALLPDPPTTSTSVTDSPRGSLNLRLPLKMGDVQKKKVKQPRLIHPLLNNIPMQLRFGFNGFMNNVLFMIAYNTAVQHFDNVDSSTVYSVVYLGFIPITHACISLFVFGWPERYFTSLMSNFPIGLTAIALGAALTAYLDKIHFNHLVTERIKYMWIHLGYLPDATVPLEEPGNGEFYSSLLVLLVTGVWTFILSVFINAPPETTEKKDQ